MGRRLCGTFVSGEALLSVAKNHFKESVFQIPESAIFHSAHFDRSRNCFVVLFEDDSLSEVPETGLIPMLYDVPLINEVPGSGS